MDFGIFYEIQVNSPLKHREREAEVFHQVLNQVVAALRAGDLDDAGARRRERHIRSDCMRRRTCPPIGASSTPRSQTARRNLSGS